MTPPITVVDAGISPWMIATQSGRKHRLGGAEQGGKGRGDEPRAGDEERKAQAEIERAEDDEDAEFARGHGKTGGHGLPRRVPATTVPRTGGRRHAHMGEAPGNDVAMRKDEGDQDRQAHRRLGETAAARANAETMIATPPITAAMASQVRRGIALAEEDPGHQRRDQRHAGLDQHDIGDGRVGEREDEGGRGRGKTEPDGNAGQGPCCGRA